MIHNDKDVQYADHESHNNLQFARSSTHHFFQTTESQIFYKIKHFSRLWARIV